MRQVVAAGWLWAPSTQAVFRAIEAGGFAARAVGGIVRNSLLGLPATDIDIATNARPGETIQLAGAAGLKTVPTGLAHGTVTVVSGGIPFEVTTLRRDIATDGRHAEVAFTDDWAADAARRDFTINALYCDSQGRVFDPLGAIGDLSPVRIVFIGDARLRIEEDYLRILRFFRFSAIYTAGGTLDPHGLAACIDLRNGLSRISGERIAVELAKLLAARHGVDVTRALVAGGIVTSIVDIEPLWADLAKLARIEAHLGTPPDPCLRLAALVVTGTGDAAKLTARLKPSAGVRDRFAALPRTAALIEPGMSIPHAKSVAYQLGRPAYQDAVLLSWARSDRAADDTNYTALAKLAQTWPLPVFPLSGRDVVAAGLDPGPRIGTILKEIESHWIETGFGQSRTALLAMLMARITDAVQPDGNSQK